MWADSPGRPFITIEQLCKHLQVKHIEALDLFFSLYSIILLYSYNEIDYRIDVIQFINFLCIFALLPTESVMLIILSANHIFANRNISDAQINIFLRSIGAESQSILFVKEWLKYVPREDNTVTILQFFDFIQSEEGVLESIYHLKKELIIHFISQHNRSKILERKFFYDHQAKLIKEKYKISDPVNNKKKKSINIQPPKESCFSIFMRMFTRDPSPYYTEYRNITQTHFVNSQMLVYEIRCKYGYSQRPYSICGSIGSRSSNKQNTDKIRRTTISNFTTQSHDFTTTNTKSQKSITSQQQPPPQPPQQQIQQNPRLYSSNGFRSPAISKRALIHSPIGNNRTLLANSPIMNNRRVVSPFISPTNSERRLSEKYIIGTPVRSSQREKVELKYVDLDTDEFNEKEEGKAVSGDNVRKNLNDLFNNVDTTPLLSPCSVVAQRAIGILDCSKSNQSLLANKLSMDSSNSKGSKNSAKVVPIEFSDEVIQ